MSKIASTKVVSLFDGGEVKISPAVDLIDALLIEVEFVHGIEAALNGIEVIDICLMDGAKQLVRAHADRLRAIGKLAETVRESVRS